MPTLTSSRLTTLLQPYLGVEVTDNNTLINQLSLYLDLLLRWNARTNLTAIREPEAIVTRHFGESLFAAHILNPRLPNNATLMDFGSGAGFPGLPIQLYRPDLRVTLAESQNKKSTFLREAVRTLGLTTEVWAARAETMPTSRTFDCVTLRAVDKMDTAIADATTRVSPTGLMAILAGETPDNAHPTPLALWPQESHSLPESANRHLQLYLHPTP
jgi:16S rRNA (guanine527-N7)-methyltransferase